MHHKVVVATRSFGSTTTEPWATLESHGCEVMRLDGATVTGDELAATLGDADGLIVGALAIPERIMAVAPRLRVISMHGVGVDHIDIDAATSLGIIVTNCPGANTEGVADLTLGLMLALARPILAGNLALKRGEWGRFLGVDVTRKTLGLVGFGCIGSAVARRARGFDMELLVHDPFVAADELERQGASSVSMNDLLRRSDFITLHAPLTDATRSVIDAAALGRMKATAYVINTARGELIDEEALLEALDAGSIAGAGLDVFTDEPPIDRRLIDHPKVLATPHIGSHSAESITKVSVMAAMNVVNVLEGEEPIHRVN